MEQAWIFSRNTLRSSDRSGYSRQRQDPLAPMLADIRANIHAIPAMGWRKWREW